MVDGDPSLRHHHLQRKEAQIESHVLLDAEQDQGSIKMPSFEHCFPASATGASADETLQQNRCDGSPDLYLLQ